MCVKIQLLGVHLCHLCLYIYKHACMRIYVYTYMQARKTYTFIYAHIIIMLTNTGTLCNAHTYACMRIYAYTHMHSKEDIHIHSRIYYNHVDKYRHIM